MKTRNPFLINAARVLTLVAVASASASAFSSVSIQQTGLSRPATLSDINTLQTQGLNDLYLSDFEMSETVFNGTVGELHEVFNQPQYVEVRVNDNGSALTEDVLPQVVSELGYEDFSLADMMLESGTLPSGITTLLACHNSGSVWELNMNDIEVELPLDSDSVQAIFRDDGRLNTDLQIDRLGLEFEMQFYYPRISSWYCDLFGTTYNFRVNVNVDGASGEFDVQTDAVSQHTYVTDIKKFALDVDSVSFDSSFLTSLTNIGIGISNLFGSGCATLTQCVNNALDDQLSSNTVIQNKLKDAINDALDRSLAIEGGFNIGTAAVDYSVGLEDLVSSNTLDRLTSVWDVAFDSDQADDPCADALHMTTFFPGNGITTGNDLEIVLPFKKITDLLYVIGKKGALCASAGVPGTNYGLANLSVSPAGHFDIRSVDDNVLELVVPMQSAVNVLSASGELEADLVLTAELNPACGAGLSLAVTDVGFENVAGSLEWSVLGHEVEVDATDFVTGIANDLALDIEAALDDKIDVLPESFGLQDVARYVATGDIASNNSAIAVGVNVVNYDPNCN